MFILANFFCLRAVINLPQTQGYSGVSSSYFWQQALVTKQRCGLFWISDFSSPAKVFNVLVKAFRCVFVLFDDVVKKNLLVNMK